MKGGDNMNMFIESCGGRKFVGFIAISGLLFVLVVLKLLPVEQFTTFIIANFGIYVAGNSIEKFS